MIQSPSISLSQANTNYSSPSVPCPTVSSPQQLATPMNNLLSVLLSQILAGSAIQDQGASLVQSPQPGTGSALQAGLAVIDCNNLFWVLLISGNISHCQGCLGKIMRGSDGKPLPPPDDLVV